jgi:putative membrane protein insertion efficiency factor
MKKSPQHLGVYFAQLVIRFYQKTISLDHGILKKYFPYGYCRFHPTCSEYAYQSLEHFGLIKGSYKTIIRLLKCHPWSSGGHDPVK